MSAGYLVKHLFPYLNADYSMSKKNGRGPPLGTQKVDLGVPLKEDNKSTLKTIFKNGCMTLDC